MISYHADRDNIGDAKKYSKSFIAVSTKGDLNRIATCMQLFVWSPIIFKDGVRRKTHFERADYIGLDFDDGEITMQDACDKWQDRACVIGPTKSYDKLTNPTRFRVLFKLERSIYTAAEYEATARFLVEKEGCDKNAKDAARFFWPCKKDGVMHVFNGEFMISVSPPLNTNYEITDAAKLMRFESHGLPKHILSFLKKGTVPSYASGRNSFMYQIAKDLLKFGFSTQDIIAHFEQAPFDRKKWRADEITTIVASALTSVKRGV